MPGIVEADQIQHNKHAMAAFPPYLISPHAMIFYLDILEPEVMMCYGAEAVKCLMRVMYSALTNVIKILIYSTWMKEWSKL